MSIDSRIYSDSLEFKINYGLVLVYFDYSFLENPILCKKCKKPIEDSPLLKNIFTIRNLYLNKIILSSSYHRYKKISTVAVDILKDKFLCEQLAIVDQPLCRLHREELFESSPRVFRIF